MTKQDDNVSRALKILATNPSCDQIYMAADGIIVGDQHLDIHDDETVIQVLLGNDEFESAIECYRERMYDLEAMRSYFESEKRRLKPVEPVMTDENALQEIEQARAVLQKHLNNGFLLGFWHEQYDGFQYGIVAGHYEHRAANAA